MALINCPECGKQVSDKAATCINCGCPLSFDNKVKMRFMVKPVVDVYGRTHVHNDNGTVYTTSGKLLYRGGMADIVFEINEPTEVIVNVDGYRKKNFENCKKVIEPGKKYVIKQISESGFLGVAIFGIVEVDVFDSDL